MTDSPIDSPLLDMEGMIGFCGEYFFGFVRFKALIEISKEFRMLPKISF